MEKSLISSSDRSNKVLETATVANNIKRNADGRIVCNLCDGTFTQLSSYKQHAISHSGLKPFVCEYCNKGFVRRSVLNIHKRLHTGDKPHKCDVCVLAFVTKDRLEAHKKRDHTTTKKSSRNYYCQVCRKKFKSHFEKQLHQQINDSPCFEKIKSKYVKDTNISSTSVAASYLTCITCHKKFSTAKDLFDHQKGRDSTSFECEMCEILFPDKTELLNHQTVAHKEDENHLINNQIDSIQPSNTSSREEHSAEDNDKNTSSSSSIQYSGDRKGKEKIRNICCICNAEYSLAWSLRTHLRSHTNERPYECKFCSKRFTRNSLLKVHLRIHTKERPYGCKQCSAAFDFKRKLETHIKRAHDHSTEIEHVLHCSHCDKVFFAASNLQEHVATVHESVVVDYKCQACGNVLHCSHCDKVFSGTSNLQEHVATVHESVVVDYKCEVCGNEFNDFMTYKNHAVTHESEEHISAEHENANETNELESDNCTIPCAENVRDVEHLEVQIGKNTCKICKKLFDQKIDLITHIKREHVCMANRSSRCHFCNELFYDVVLLDEHLADVHEDRTFLYHCPECSDVFKSSLSHRRHIYKKHDAVRIRCCETNCGEYFDSVKSFDLHVLKHYT